MKKDEYLCRIEDRDGEHIITVNGTPRSKIEFVNIIDKPGGKLRTKFQLFIGKKSKHVDLFIRDLSVGIKTYVSGSATITTDDVEKKLTFALTFEYQILKGRWYCSGSVNGSAVTKYEKKLGSIIQFLKTLL